jgi:hypothetical protein
MIWEKSSRFLNGRRAIQEAARKPPSTSRLIRRSRHIPALPYWQCDRVDQSRAEY